MPPESAAAERSPPPTAWKAGLFLLKARAFQLQRALREIGRPPRRFKPAPASPQSVCLSESRSDLYSSQVPAEFKLQAGKVQNLRVAAAHLNGIVIPRGEIFSFWAHVPRPTRRRGFAAGRELREGCIIPSIGGGLCQLSNALHEVALGAGCEIVERHAHSQRVPGSMAESGRDATIFWNYVDLRFRPRVDCRLEVELTRRDLIVRLHALPQAAPLQVAAPVTGGTVASAHPQHAESCETCGVTDCFRHAEQTGPGEDIAAWLVDGWWPEFDQYIQQHRQVGDWLFLPLRSSHFGNYRWQTDGFAEIRQAPWETLRRSWTSRHLAAQGAARQRALLRFDEELAARYLRRLPVAALHLVVSQTLLPHLWRAGALGGRTFDVLMTRLPMAHLHATLDRAAARHPRSRTLADFRAPAELAAAEAAALAGARYWITPHSTIAHLAGGRAVKLPWHLPRPPRHRGPAGNDILFPASTLARKGAYELAQAARALGLRVQLGGPLLEGAECWGGNETSPAARDWKGVGVVALPAWVEHQPRALLKAVSARVPVIAAEGCGLEDVPGVVTVPEGDVAALTAALARLIPNPACPTEAAR